MHRTLNTYVRGKRLEVIVSRVGLQASVDVLAPPQLPMDGPWGI